MEYKKYEKGFFRGGEPQNPNGRSGSGQKLTEEEKKDNRRQTMQRAKTTIRNLINANTWQYGEIIPKFVTLTFKDNVEHLTISNKLFKEFIQRLNWSAYRSRRGKIQYLAVIEFQKRGAVHYHVVFFNLPYIDSNKLAEIWSHGFIKINKIDQVDNVGAYVTKYLTKENDDRLIGKKCYLSSRGLKQPIEITEKKMVESVLDSLPDGCLAYSTEYENDHLGHIQYQQYNTARIANKKEAEAV